MPRTKAAETAAEAAIETLDQFELTVSRLKRSGYAVRLSPDRRLVTLIKNGWPVQAPMPVEDFLHVHSS